MCVCEISNHFSFCGACANQPLIVSLAHQANRQVDKITPTAKRPLTIVDTEPKQNESNAVCCVTTDFYVNAYQQGDQQPNNNHSLNKD